MKVTTEELERCEVLMTVEVEAQREQDILQKAAKKIARQIKIPGFRPGKAPYNVVVRRFGLEAIQQEAFEDSADKLVQDALNEANVQPFAQIQLESVEWDPLVIKVKVPTPPVVELGEYRDIRLEAEPVEVSEEDVDKALQDLQERTATWTPVERPAELGDMVTMSVVEKDGEEVLAQNDSVEYELVHHEHDHEEDEDEEEESSSESSDESSEDEREEEAGEGEDEEEAEDDEGVTASHWHPDLVTPLLGLSAGEEKSFTVDYPADFSNERYAGKTITFEVKVSSVKAKEKDPLDDEFAKTVSDFETLEELRADIKENIRQQREAERNRKLGNEVLDQIVENSKIEWPAAFENESLEQEVSRLTREMEAYGLSLTNYLQIQNQSQEEFTEQLRDRVVEQLKWTLVMGKVAEQEKLRVSEGEILERAKLIADMTGRGDQFWRNILASEAQQSRIANDILVDKVINWLAAIARGEEPTVEAADEEEAAETTAAEADVAADEAEGESAGAEVDETTEAEAEVSEPEAEAVEAEADETAEAEAEEAAEPDEDKSESAGEPAATKA